MYTRAETLNIVKPLGNKQGVNCHIPIPDVFCFGFLSFTSTPCKIYNIKYKIYKVEPC